MSKDIDPIVDPILRYTQQDINKMIESVANRPQQELVWESTRTGRAAVEELRQHIESSKRKEIE